MHLAVDATKTYQTVSQDAISLQSSAVDGMMYNQVTSEKLKHALGHSTLSNVACLVTNFLELASQGSVRKNLSDSILRPADQAVECPWLFRCKW